jgi:uncharacterized protein
MNFQDYQRAFTARIRDPQARPRPPGASARRMKVYEALLYNNLEGFLLGCFPVSRKILGARRWKRLVRAFFRDHACHTPYFRQIPEEFLKYIQDEWTAPEDFPAFLPELVHYEWVELGLDVADSDRNLPGHDPDGDLWLGAPLVNPVLRVLAYRWPVHRLSPRFKPVEPPQTPTFIVAWRDASLSVRFQQLNPAAARFLDMLVSSPGSSGQAAASELARALGHPEASLAGHARDLLHAWRAEGLLLGAATPGAAL